MWKLPNWALPVISGCVWLVMLLVMLLDWIGEGRPHYTFMDPDQTIPYISDIGADRLKPLFITGSTITAIFLDCAFASERWLRHQSRLEKKTPTIDKVIGALTLVFAAIGTIGLILLGIIDTFHYPTAHGVFVLLFIVGFIISAIFMCWEFQRLEIHYRQNKILLISFWVKLGYIVVEAALAVAFAVCKYLNISNSAAVLEWVVAFIFTFYIFSYLIDLLPFVHRKHDSSSETAIAANAS